MAARERFALGADLGAMKISIGRDAAVAAALSTIVVDGVAGVQANAAAVAASADAEHLHQLRVGLRRLRSALALFKRFAQAPAHVRDELRGSARQLGQARDAEVLAQETLARVPVPVNLANEWALLRGAAAAAAATARQQAVDTLREPRHLRWQLALLGWVHSLADEDESLTTGPMQVPSEAPARPPLEGMPGRELRRLRKGLINSGRHLRGPDAAARHRVRIAAKKLRYATEFFATLYQPKASTPFIRSMAALQDELGSLNDAEVATDLLHRLAAGSPALAAAAGYAQGWLAADASQRVRWLGKLWKRARRDL